MKFRLSSRTNVFHSRSFSHSRFDSLGFIEVEYLLAAALGVILLAALAGALATISQTQRVNDIASDADDLVQAIALTVNAGDRCTDLLRNKPYNTAAPQEVSFPIELGSRTIVVQAGAEPSDIPGLRIKNFQLIHNPDYQNIDPQTLATSPYTVIDDASGVTQNLYLATLRIITERLDGPRVTLAPPRDIPIKVSVNTATNAIVTCNSEASEARLCRETGGEFNPAAVPPAPRCIPKTHCEFGGSFSTAPASEGGFNNPLTGGQSCDTAAGFVVQRTGTTSWAYSGGKYRVRNSYYPVYTCVRCDDISAVALGSAVVIDQDATGAFGGNAPVDYDNDVNNFMNLYNFLDSIF